MKIATVLKPVINNSEDFAKIASPILDKYKVPLPVGMGQYAAEGRNKGAGASRNNFYNIAAYDKNPLGMNKYKTPQAGIEAYAKLLSTDKRYATAYKNRDNPDKMLAEIKKAGYATRPDYVKFVTSTPEYKRYSK